MSYYEDGDRILQERKRFYLQQKSCRPECNFGSKNCERCENENCTIRQFILLK